MSDNKKILVTGSEGQLGKTLQKRCSGKYGFDWIFLPKKKLDIKSIIQNFALIVRHSPMY